MIKIHATADVAESAIIGDGVRIWQQVQIRENAKVGENSNVGKGVYIGLDVVVGKNCKIHNYSLLHEGAAVEDGVFVGPHVVFANDMYPRAINPDGTQKGVEDWHMAVTTVKYGAAIGTRSVLLPGITVGRFALVGAGSIVTKDVPAYGLVRGNPARLVGNVCACAKPSVESVEIEGEKRYICPVCAPFVDKD